MSGTRTFTMIKPDAVKAGHIGAILERINAAGFRIAAMKYTQLTKRDAELFYAVHAERPFYGELVEFMSSGPIVGALAAMAIAEIGSIMRLQTSRDKCSAAARCTSGHTTGPC